MFKRSMRVISMVLVIALTAALVPAAVFADDGDPAPEGGERAARQEFPLDVVPEEAAAPEPEPLAAPERSDAEQEAQMSAEPSDEDIPQEFAAEDNIGGGAILAEALPEIDQYGRVGSAFWNFGAEPFIVTDSSGTHPDASVFPVNSGNTSRYDVNVDSITPEKFGGLRYSLTAASAAAYVSGSSTFEDGFKAGWQIKTGGSSSADKGNRVFSFLPSMDGRVTVYARCGSTSSDSTLHIAQGSSVKDFNLPSQSTAAAQSPVFTADITANAEVKIYGTGNIAFYAVKFDGSGTVVPMSAATPTPEPTSTPKPEPTSTSKPTTAPAGGTVSEAEGTCGTNLTWRLKDGVLTISGTGEMEYYTQWSASPWRNYRNSIKSVIISDGVTSIGSYAFAYCGSLEKIEIPDTVGYIGGEALLQCESLTTLKLPNYISEDYYTTATIREGAFNECTGLTKVIIPGCWYNTSDAPIFSGCDNLKTAGPIGGGYNIEFGWTDEIPEYMFSNLSSLTDVVLPESISIISSNAFENCTSLTNVNFTESITVINYKAFYGCTGLTKIVLPKNPVDIESSAFGKCSGLKTAGPVGGGYNVEFYWKDEFGSLASMNYLTSVTIPDSITSIGEYAFGECSRLSEITIPKGVTSIGQSAFVFCSGLTSVSIPSGVTIIEDSTFSGCSGLTSVTIPDGVTSIGSSAFRDCSGLTSVSIPSGVTIIENSTFSGCSGLTSVTIPDGVTSIGDFAFYGCSGLTSVTIPDGVTSIGSYAFEDCSGLTSVTIPSGVTSIGGYAFSYCSGLTSVTISEGITSIEEHAFSGCGGLTSVTIPSSVTSIDNNAFENCSGLTSVTISEGVTSIGSGAFRDCSGLTSVTIPSSVESFGLYPFEDCKGLKTAGPIGGGYNIEFGWTESIPGWAFSACSSLTSVTFPSTITSIGESAFYSCGITNITFPSGLTNIGSSAFSYCSLTSVTIPSSVTSITGSVFSGCSGLKTAGPIGGGYDYEFGWTDAIPDYAFCGCSGLTSVTIPSSVTSIGDSAFSGCSGLTSVTIPDGVISIGYDVFSYCSGLTSVTIPDRVTSIGEFAFSYCSGLTSVTIPNRVTSIGRYAFSYCGGLTSVTIPDSVTSIGDDAFSHCSGLTSVTIPESVTSIGYGAFYGCSSELVLYVEPDSRAEQYAVDNNIEFEYLIIQKSNIKINVTDEIGNAVSGGFTVEWRKKDSDDIISTGNTLTNANSGKTYSYKLRLDESLSMKYIQPATAEVTAGDQDAEITVKLMPQPKAKISGRAVNEAGEPLAGADVLISQIINGSIKNEVKTVTGENGEFSAEIIRADADIAISLNGRYDALKNCSVTADTYNAGDITLQKLPDSKITLNMNLISASESGVSSAPLDSFAGITVKLFNITRNSAITPLAVQYPYIIIDTAELNVGDVIEINASDSSGKTSAEPVTVKIDEYRNATGTVEFKENGRIKAESVSGESISLALIYNSEGNLVKKQEISDSFKSEPLADGDYRVVFIKKTDLLSGVGRLSDLSDIGLNEGRDYAVKSASVTNGAITNIGGVTVPGLDESKLYYTVSGETYYTSNKSICPAGRLVTMTAKYKIDEKYSTSAQKLFFALPENAEFINSSLLVDGVQTPYTLENGGVSVITNSPQATVKFYTAAAAAGEYDLSAYLSFTEGGREVTQPIGSATFSVEDTAFSVTERTNNKTVPISGTVFSKSNVTIYKNGEPVGSVTANANGSWSYDLDIDTTYNLSQTEIYAEIETPYGAVLRTDTKKVLYDKDCAVVSKVTMYKTNGGMQCVVFDFLNPSSTAPSYSMSSYVDFTFTIEFIGEADNVVLYVKTQGGNVYSYDAEYDEDKGLWVVATQVEYFNDSPVNVAVDYVSKNNVEISRNEIDDVLNEYYNGIEQIEREKTETAALLDEMDAIAGKMFEQEIDKSEFDRLCAQYRENQNELFSYVPGIEDISFEEPQLDFTGMSDAEISAFMENELDAQEHEIDELIAENEAETDVDDILTNIWNNVEISNCDGLTPEGLEADGYQKIGADDSSAVLTKISDDEIHYVDFGRNENYTINVEAEAQLLSYQAEAAAEPQQEVNDKPREPIIAYDQIGSAVRQITVAIDTLRDDVLPKCANSIESKTKRLQFFVQRYHNWTAEWMIGMYSNDSERAVISAARRAKVRNTVRRLCREIDRMKRTVNLGELSRKIISKAVAKFTAALDVVTTVYTNSKILCDLYAKMPLEGECNRERVQEAKYEFWWMAGLMAGYCTAQAVLAAMMIADIGATGGSAGYLSPATIPVGIVIIIGQIGLSFLYDYSVGFKEERVKALIDDAQCINKEKCPCCYNNMLRCTCNDNPMPTPTRDPGEKRIPSAYDMPPFCPQTNAMPILDPSGYVCEAVPSNRLEGVTATAYYLGDVLDDFGEPTGEKTPYVWDALDYDQINPLITDANGEYAWDVPEGSWQVKYEKEGYETAYSEWMPVPPPQTEVHVAMVSKAAPEVAAVNAYKDRVKITFSKYMRIDTVNTNSVKLTSGGAEIAGTIAPIDAEASFDDPSVMYARTFVFTPATELSGSVSARVSGAVSYSGTPMAEYAADAAVKAEPEELSVGESVGIGSGSTAEIGFVILPKEAATGAKINVKSLSPSIVSAAAETATAGADGRGNITVNGVLPGSGDIVLEIEGTDISKTIRVNVAAISAGRFDKRLVPIEVSGAGAGHAIIAAAYDGDVMVGSATRTASGSGTDILNLECGANTKTAKIMEWESFDSLRPMKPAEERQIN